MTGCFSDNILTVCHLNTFGSDQRFIAHSNCLFCEKDELWLILLFAGFRPACSWARVHRIKSLHQAKYRKVQKSVISETGLLLKPGIHDSIT